MPIINTGLAAGARWTTKSVHACCTVWGGGFPLGMSEPKPRPASNGIDRALLKLVETRWQIILPNRTVLSCGIYRTAGSGFEVRCAKSEDHLIRSERTANLVDARTLADRWEQIVIKKVGRVERSEDLDI